MLQENSWECGLGSDKFEVIKIVDGQKIRCGRVNREVVVQSMGYSDPSWIDEAGLNCGALLQE